MSCPQLLLIFKTLRSYSILSHLMLFYGYLVLFASLSKIYGYIVLYKLRLSCTENGDLWLYMHYYVFLRRKKVLVPVIDYKFQHWWNHQLCTRVYVSFNRVRICARGSFRFYHSIVYVCHKLDTYRTVSDSERYNKTKKGFNNKLNTGNT